jgi:hypothetical protein
MTDGPAMCPECAACKCGRAAHDRAEIESMRSLWDERGREIDRLNAALGKERARGWADAVEAGSHEAWEVVASHARDTIPLSLADEVAAAIRSLAPPYPEPAPTLLNDSDATITLLNRHADKALEYLKMNGDDPLVGDEDADSDTRAVIWNQMSALLSEAARWRPASPADRRRILPEIETDEWMAAHAPPAEPRECPACEGVGIVEFTGNTPGSIPHPGQCPACGGTGRASGKVGHP